MKRGCITGILLVLLITQLGVSYGAAEEISVDVVREGSSPSFFTINATAGPGGTIEPCGIVEVAAGGNQTFIITPDPADLSCWGGGTRYVVWNLSVNGQKVNSEPSIYPVQFNFTDVQSDQTINAEFTTMIIDARPSAQFSGDILSGLSPLMVNFSQGRVSNNTGLLWSFGDNTTSIEQNPNHTYTDPGFYTVSLTIYCNDEYFIEEKQDYILVTIPPVANFTMDQTMGMRPLTVQFNDTSTGTPPLSYEWDFGDSTTSTEQNPVHTYTLSGTYRVNLTVRNDAGNSTKSADQPIMVYRPIGGDKGYFLVHSNVDGANVYLDDHFKGVIDNGTFLIQIYTTASPYYTYTVEKSGYQTVTAPITERPVRDETVDLYADLIPFTGFYVPLQSGWNLFSTPIALEPGLATLGAIFNETEQQHISVIFGWNGTWFIPDESYSLVPLHAVYVKVNGSATAALVPSDALTVIPSRALPEGISLIGPAPAYQNGKFSSMPLDQALISIDQIQGGLMGYSMVVSPGLNQPGWVYARGGDIQDIIPFKGYWVVMENPDMLYGFSTTPI